MLSLSLSLSLSATLPTVCSLYLSSRVFNSPFALCPFSSTMVVSPRSRSFCSFPSHVTSRPLSHSTSHYWRALMSTLARSVNYSITGRRISHPTPPSLVRSKNSFMLGMNHLQLLDIEMLIVPSCCRAEQRQHVLKHSQI